MKRKRNAINCLKLGIVASVITLVFFSFQNRSWVHQWMEPNRHDRPLQITDQSFQHEVVNVVISTPVSIVAALAAAARHGVLIKGGLFMEIPSTLRAIALD